MSTHPPAPPPLARLGAALQSRRDLILQQWHALADADAELSTASTLSRGQFRDHIPDVLEAFARRLSAERGTERDQADVAAMNGAVSHGIVRWQQGYQQRELMREWRHLHVVLVDAMEGIASEDESLNQDTLKLARRELAALISDGVCESASQYAVLQRAEAEARLRDMEQAVADFQRAQGVHAQLLREATHDLRGGLGVVHLATTALKHQAAETLNEDAIAVAERGVAAMQALLEDLISLARLEAGHERVHLAAFDAGTLLREVGASMLPLAAARRLELVVTGAESLPVHGDPVKVQRIVQNLLQNALRYTVRGRVSLSWSALADDPAGRWAITVADTGPGIASGNATAMTRALRDATDEARDAAPGDVGEVAPGRPDVPVTLGARQSEPAGEGIGLSIVKRLCELLDAQLELHSEPGTGSTFRVILPGRFP